LNEASLVEGAAQKRMRAETEAPATGGVRWPARLRLDARLAGPGDARPAGPATLLHGSHIGPLRLLKTLYPEGPGIAHAVLVHPPGGLVGGDRLDIEVHADAGAHLLVTTPSATRFYRSVAGEAVQAVRAHLAPGARLEWLPQETLAYAGCDGRNDWQVHLAADAAVMAMEVLALGLGESQRPFSRGGADRPLGSKARMDEGTGPGLDRGVDTSGRFVQQFEITGDNGRLWRERGVIDAVDQALLDGPCGLAGRRVLGTLLLAAGSALDAPMAEAALEAARAELAPAPPAAPVTPALLAGVTLLHGRLLLLRVLAHEVEPTMRLLRRVRGLWRQRYWGLPPNEPRLWAS
jgi:urease accessory protein